MKIMIVMGGFFPGKNYGGPPVSVKNFCTLMDDCECFIITTNHDLGDKKKYSDISEGWNNRDNCKVLYLPDDKYNYKSFLKIAREIKPDLIYLQGLFQSCVFPCLRIAKKLNIRVVLAPRGEICEGALKIRKTSYLKKRLYIFVLKLLKLFKGVEFQSTSAEETDGIKKYFKVGNDMVFQLSNIPSLPCDTLVHSPKKKDTIRAVFISRIHPKKNLLLVIDKIMSMSQNIIFDIYGPIEDVSYWEDCKNKINKCNSNVTITYMGTVSHDDVHSTFAKYDVFFFLTQSENYGHVIIESLMSGTPVVISDKTPWNDLEKNEAGFVLNLDNLDRFSTIVDEISKLDEEMYSRYRLNAKKYAIEKNNIVKLKEMYKKKFKI